MSKKIDKVETQTLVPEGTGLRVHLSIEVWPSTDLLMSLLAVVDRPAQRVIDAGSAWRDRAAAVPGDLLGAIDRYAKETWINLLGLPLDVPEARDPAGFVQVVRELPAEEVVRYLSGYYRRVFRRETPARVMEDAIFGDRKAQREFRRTSFADIPAWRATLRRLLAAPPNEVRAEFADVVGRWQAEVFARHEEELRAAAERAARGLRDETEGLPPEAIVERAVPGVTYVPEVGQTNVVLVPTTAIRPGIVILDHRTSNVFAFPVPSVDRAAPPPARLVRLGKAIGDETRLRILRELASRPATPPDLADRMGMPRTTLLHHLSILRGAGLIAVNIHDSAYHTYEVRDEHLGDVGRLLEQFLADD